MLIIKHNPSFVYVNGYNIRTIEIFRETASDEIYYGTEVEVTYCVDKGNAGAPEAWAKEAATYLSRESAQMAIDRIVAWTLRH